MSGMADERTWRHEHVCPGCSTKVICFNPSCSEPEVCMNCREEKQTLIHEMLLEIHRLETQIAQAQQEIADAWVALRQLGHRT